MKMRQISIALCLLMFFSISVYAQDGAKLPSVNIKNLQGATVNTSNFSNDGKPFIINFWATWCKPCIAELKAINDVYEDWQEQTGVKMFAVSIDNSRSSRRVAPFVNGNNLKFDFYLDENSDFSRALNVSNPPHTFLCNGKGEIVWQHNGYAPGAENELFKQVKLLLEAEQNQE